MVTLHDALIYHHLGLAVVRVKPGTKQPAAAWKRYQELGPGESQVRRWFGDDDQQAIAVLNGKPSGNVISRDFDDMAAYEAWAAEHPKLAKQLPTVATPRPGRHVYAKVDVDQVRRASPSGATIIPFDDGELRAGGITLLPPSVNDKVVEYRWLGGLPDDFPRIELSESGFVPCDIEASEVLGGPRGLKTLSESSMASTASMVHDSIELAIVEAIPEKGGRRHRAIFELARALKAIPSLADAPAVEMKPHVRRWYQASIGTIRTKPFEDSWLDFAEAWGKVKFPKGQEPIAMIFASINDRDLPEVLREYETPGIKQLAAFCRELQRASGEGPFFLACRTAAGLLDIDHATASRWLRLLQHDGVIQLAEKGSHEKRRANLYRYLYPV